MAVAGAAGLLVACGTDSSRQTSSQQTSSQQTSVSVTSTTAVPGRSYAGDLTTTDGSYTVTVLVGPASALGSPECPATATPGKTFLPVTLTVANKAADKGAAFPPLRIEMVAGAGAKPDKVLVRDPSGSCTSTPKVASVGPGASVMFRGTSPAIDATAAPGAAGRIQVSVSETTFALVAPVP